MHCHILPGVDDGPKAIQESIEMAKVAAEEGITSIIATPHHLNGRYENVKSLIQEKVSELNLYLKAEKIPIEIFPGQETRIYGELLADYQTGDIQTLHNTSYCLVELPTKSVPRYTDRLFYELLMNGLTPVIAHPERNSRIRENPDLLFDLIRKGAIAQLTAGSITGQFGKSTKNFAMKLIRANLVHFIASDAHNISTRTFCLGEAYEAVEKTFGEEQLWLFRENAELLMKNKKVYQEVPNKIKTKKLLWFL